MMGMMMMGIINNMYLIVGKISDRYGSNIRSPGIFFFFYKSSLLMTMQYHGERIVAQYQIAAIPWGSGIYYRKGVTNRDGEGGD